MDCNARVHPAEVWDGILLSKETPSPGALRAWPRPQWPLEIHHPTTPAPPGWTAPDKV